MQLSASTFSVACNQASRDPFKDAFTSQPLIIYRGNRVKIRGALFTGSPSASTFVNDISNLTGADLIIRALNSTGTPLVEKSLPASALNGSLTFDQWTARTGWHFEFDLLDTDTNQTPGAIYIAIDVVTNDSGDITVATATNGWIIEDGIGNAGTPTAADFTSYSKAQADARFEPISPVGTSVSYAPTITSATGTTSATDLGGVNDSALPTYFALQIPEYLTNPGVGLTTWVIEPTSVAANGARSINVNTYDATANPRAWRQRA